MIRENIDDLHAIAGALLKRETLDQLEKGRTEPQQLAINALRRKLDPHKPDDVRYTPTIPEEVERTKALAPA